MRRIYLLAAVLALLLMERGGRVGVWSGENAEPDCWTDIEPGELREADREMLKNGIAAEGRGELLALIEDFGS